MRGNGGIRMKLCEFDCIPCCDFCKHVALDIEDGINFGPKGCKLHPDEEHKEIAIGLGYCDDFICKNVKED